MYNAMPNDLSVFNFTFLYDIYCCIHSDAIADDCTQVRNELNVQIGLQYFNLKVFVLLIF